MKVENRILKKLEGIVIQIIELILKIFLQNVIRMGVHSGIICLFERLSFLNILHTWL